MIPSCSSIVASFAFATTGGNRQEVSWETAAARPIPDISPWRLSRRQTGNPLLWQRNSLGILTGEMLAGA